MERFTSRTKNLFEGVLAKRIIKPNHVPVTLDKLEEEFSDLIQYFRQTSDLHDLGYAGDHAGYIYFDPNNNESEHCPEIDLYFDDFTFRIQKNIDHNHFESYFVVIDKFESESKRVYASSKEAAENIIYNIIKDTNQSQNL